MSDTVTVTERPLRPRRVRFDWNGVPLQWMPDDPGTSHVTNVLHPNVLRAARAGRLPLRGLFVAVPRYLGRSYHPSQEGTIDAAIVYLDRSPAVAAIA